MARLAQNSDGNHAFVENARDLARIFDAEFKDAMGVVATRVRIDITLAPGVRPVRIMNRDGDIVGQEVRLQLNQVLDTQEKYVLVELEIPAGRAGTTLDLARARSTWLDLATGREGSTVATATIAYEADESRAQASVNRAVKEQVILQIATEANEQAVELADEGKIEQAQELLRSNSLMLDSFADTLASPALRAYAGQNAEAAEAVEGEAWEEQRKVMREEQLQNKTQRSY